MSYSFIRAGVFPTAAFRGWRHLNSILDFSLMTGPLQHFTVNSLTFGYFSKTQLLILCQFSAYTQERPFRCLLKLD